jgi:hypothetical protein
LQVAGVFLDVGNNAVPTFADIDRDSDLDLYVGGETGTVEVFTNNSGVFTAAGTLVLTDAFSLQSKVIAAASPTFADIDADGDLDLYVGSLNGITNVFSNNNGVFTYAYQLGMVASIRANPAFADVDADGDLDLYLNGQGANIRRYNNNGGVFSSTPVNVEAIDLILDVGSASTPAVADIDLDGDLDLYVGTGNGEIAVFTNSNGVFTEVLNLQNGNGNTIDKGNQSTPTFADLDSDGDLDLYVGEYNGNVNFGANTNGVFTFGANLVGQGAGYAESYSSPAFADIDGDGDLDLYVGQYYGEIEVFTNNNGVFTTSGKLQVNTVNIDVVFSASPTFADIDNDGDLDLYAGDNNGNVQFFTNTNGVFATPTNLQAGGANIDAGSDAAPIFADIDGDGDLDLYVGNRVGKITFYENIAPITVGIKEVASQNVSIYPNPVKNNLFIELENQEVTSINIIDFSGKVVQVITNTDTTNIDVSDLPQGIYVLKLSTENGILTNKFIKQ